MDNYTLTGNVRVLIEAAAPGEKGYVTRTRLQKFAYLVQEVMCIPLGLSFRLSYYGPYSQDLASATDLLKQHDAVVEDEDESGYRIRPAGPCPLYEPSPNLDQLRMRSALARLRSHSTGDLMLMATAHFIEASSTAGGMDDESLAVAVKEVKPPFDIPAILTAIGRLRELQALSSAGS